VAVGDLHDPHRASLLRLDEQHWTRFLERQDGFVRKEVWRDRAAGDRVHAVIWWTSMEAWQAIPSDALAEVAAAMGPFEREASCVALDLLERT
jgi:uncharacterized protein (TIGR03792 family)